jgi:nitroreductase
MADHGIDTEASGRVAELIRTQRAVREYTGQEVPDELIRIIVNAGRRAQSSKNAQPWSFVVVRDRDQLRRLAEGGKFAAHVPESAFTVALVSAMTGGADGFDLGQAAAYLMVTAWDYGIGSCVTWMHFPEKSGEALNLPEDLKCHVVVAFGYPAPRDEPLPARKDGRKPFDEVVRWERW